MNRAYYPIFSLTNAVLLTKGSERSKHSGVESAFIEKVVKSEIFELEYGKNFDYIRKKREESDYSLKIRIDEGTAKKVVKGTEKFIARMKNYFEGLGIKMGNPYPNRKCASNV